MNFFKSSSSPMNLHPATPSRLPQAAPRSEKPGIVEKIRRKAGFTLVEVTLAMGLVSFALLPLMALLPQGLSTVRYSVTETALGSMLGKVRSELNQSSFDTLDQTLPSAASPWDYCCGMFLPFVSLVCLVSVSSLIWMIHGIIHAPIEQEPLDT
jgi:hypothetical protein